MVIGDYTRRRNTVHISEDQISLIGSLTNFNHKKSSFNEKKCKYSRNVGEIHRVRGPSICGHYMVLYKQPIFALKMPPYNQLLLILWAHSWFQNNSLDEKKSSFYSDVKGDVDTTPESQKTTSRLGGFYSKKPKSNWLMVKPILEVTPTISKQNSINKQTYDIGKNQCSWVKRVIIKWWGLDYMYVIWIMRCPIL